MANGINPFNQRLGGILEETKKQREERERRELELRAERLREQFDVSEPMDIPPDRRFPEGEFDMPIHDPNAGEAGRMMPPGKLTEPLPVPEPPPELTWEDMTRPQKKKFDKLKLEKEDAERDANSALILATARGDALEKYMVKIREKHPRPSGWERGLAMATGGITGAATGMFSRGRKADAAEKAGRATFADEWERVQDAAEKSKMARAGRAASTVGKADRDNISTIRNLSGVLGHYLDDTWADDLGLQGTKDTYPGQIDRLEASMLLRGKGKRKASVDPNVLSTIGAIAARLQSMKEVRDQKRLEWKRLGAANINPDGSLSTQFLFELDKEHPEAPIWALKGTLDSKEAASQKEHALWRERGSNARSQIFNILKLMGKTEDEANEEVDTMLKHPPGQRRWTSDLNTEYLKKSLAALAEYRKKTGTTYRRNANNEFKIMELDEELKSLETVLTKAEGLSPKYTKVLQQMYLGNMDKRANLVSEMFLTDPSEVEAALETFDSHLKHREDQAKSLSALAAKDLNEAMRIVGGDLWDKRGGNKEFLETVFIDKNNKVVPFAEKEHKGQERYSFLQIKPKKLRDVLAYKAKQTVLSRGVSGEPETLLSERVSVMEPTPEARVPVHLLLKQDRDFINGVSGIDLNMGTEVSREGRLIGTGREKILAWMDTPKAGEVFKEPINFAVFRKGLTPKTIELRFLGNGDIQKGKEVWDQIETVVELKQILDEIERREPQAGRNPREIDINKLPADQQKVIRGLALGDLIDHPDGSAWKVGKDTIIEVIK